METLEMKNVSVVLWPIMEMKDRILKSSDELFRQYGIRSITMDDIAKHLSISKKTIYRFFPDKDRIVNETITAAMSRVVSDLDIIHDQAKDAVEEILSILNYLNDIFTYLNPVMFHDLQKYHHEAWKIFLEFQQDCLIRNLADNMKRGIEEGLYREEIDIPIVAHLRMDQALRIIDTSVFPQRKFNLKELHAQALMLYLHGLVTLKGYRLIKRHQLKQSRISKKQKV